MSIFILHQEYILPDVRSRLANATWDKDKRVACTADDVYWFAMRDTEEQQSDFLGPRAVVWTPGEAAPLRTEPDNLEELVADDCDMGLPDVARRAFDEQDRQTQHIFLCEIGSDFAFYAGTAEFVCLNPGSVPFELVDDKLPKQIWLRFGGFDGWYVQIDGLEQIVKQEQQFGLLLNQIELNNGHLFMADYQESLLTIHFNEECAWPTWAGWRDGEYYQDLTLQNPCEAATEEWFECTCCGIPVSAERSETISHSEAIQMAKYVFRNGDTRQWQWKLR